MGSYLFCQNLLWKAVRLNMRYGYFFEDAMLIVILQSQCLKRVVLLGAVSKNGIC